MTLIEPETITIEELDLEHQCESKYHQTYTDGHDDSSPLYYVFFAGECQCSPNGVSIRCGGFIWTVQGVMAREGRSYMICPLCRKRWTMRVIEPV